MGISMNDSKPDQLVRLISGWPGLMARADRALIDDGLVLLDHLGDARSLVDVGSGAGLPGIPIKIARPDLEVALIEADQAKAAFLVHACAALGLENIHVVARRAEDAGHDPALREAFDVAVARALAPLPVLVELCLPLVRAGACWRRRRKPRRPTPRRARSSCWEASCLVSYRLHPRREARAQSSSSTRCGRLPRSIRAAPACPPANRSRALELPPPDHSPALRFNRVVRA